MILMKVGGTVEEGGGKVTGIRGVNGRLGVMNSERVWGFDWGQRWVY